MNYWWKQCVTCIGWGEVSGRCRFCSRCPYSVGGCGDGYRERICGMYYGVRKEGDDNA